MKERGQRRGLRPTVLGGILLLVLALVLGLRERTDRDPFDSRGGAVTGGSPAQAARHDDARAESRASASLSPEQARARVNSLLAVDPGEVVAVGISAEDCDRYFDLPLPDQLGESRAMIDDSDCRAALVQILLAGNPLPSELGKLEAGLRLANAHTRIELERIESHGPAENLQVELFGAEGLLRGTGLLTFKGSPIVWRLDEHGEAYLILVGADGESSDR